MKYVKNTLIICSFIFLVTGCSGVEYVENNRLRSDSDHSYGETLGVPKKFGGFVQDDRIDPETGEVIKGREIILKKHRSKYIAETLLFDNGNEAKSTFKRSYLSFGADRKNKRVGFQLTFLY